MIDTLQGSVTRTQHFLSRRPEFRLKPPVRGPLLATESMTIVDPYAAGAVEWWRSPESQGSALNRPTAVLANLVSSARRDVERLPLSANARMNLAHALLRAGVLEEAVLELQKALDLDPRHYAAQMTLAKLRVDRGELDAADHIYSRTVELYPEDSAARVQLALVAGRRKDWSRATEVLNDVIRLQDSALVRYYLGTMLLRQDRRQEALRHLRAATRMDVRSPALHQGLGVAYLAVGDFAHAERSFKAALRLAPLMPQAIQSLAALQLKRGRADEASELLTHYLETHNDDAQAREMLADAYEGLQQYRHARAQLVTIIEQLVAAGAEPAERARLTNNLGACCARLREYDAAEDAFTRAIQLDPKSLLAYQNLARLHLERGQAENALRVLGLCEEVSPRSEETPLLVAIALCKQRRSDDAIAYLEAAIRDGVHNARIYATLAELLADDRQDLGAALSVMLEAHRLYGNDAVVANNLAYVHLLRGEPSEARRILGAFPEQGVADVYLRATWGLLHLWEGDFERGKEGYLEARQLAINRGQADLGWRVRQKMGLELARAHLRLGDLRQAKAEAAAGLRVVGGNDTYKRDLKVLLADLRVREREL